MRTHLGFVEEWLASGPFGGIGGVKLLFIRESTELINLSTKYRVDEHLPSSQCSDGVRNVFWKRTGPHAGHGELRHYERQLSPQPVTEDF